MSVVVARARRRLPVLPPLSHPDIITSASSASSASSAPSVLPQWTPADVAGAAHDLARHGGSKRVEIIAGVLQDYINGVPTRGIAARWSVSCFTINEYARRSGIPMRRGSTRKPTSGRHAVGPTGTTVASVLLEAPAPVLDPEVWSPSAACKAIDAETFYPDENHRDAAKDAKATCAGCPVRAECLAWALHIDDRYGVWGGLTTRERLVLTQRRADLAAGGGQS